MIDLSEKTSIQVDVEVKDTLAKMGAKGESFNIILKRLVESNKQASVEGMKTAIVDKYGKAMISRTLAGRHIEYRIKEKIK